MSEIWVLGYITFQRWYQWIVSLRNSFYIQFQKIHSRERFLDFKNRLFLIVSYKYLWGLTREKINGIFNAFKRAFKFVETHLNARLNALFQLK